MPLGDLFLYIGLAGSIYLVYQMMLRGWSVRRLWILASVTTGFEVLGEVSMKPVWRMALLPHSRDDPR
jgi:hypothetical protein